MTESCLDFSIKGGRLKQFLYGNTFSILDRFWVSVSNFFFFLVGLMGSLPDWGSVRSDKDSSLVVFGEENPIFSSGYREHDLDGSGLIIKEGYFHGNGDHAEKEDEILDSPQSSSVVSISRRYEFFSDSSIRGFSEQHKALTFVVHGLYLGTDGAEEPAVRGKPEGSIQSWAMEKMLERSDDSTENKLKSSEGFVTGHVEEEMVVYEFMGCTDVKEEPIHENCVGGEKVWKTTKESLSDDDDFIELRPEAEISDIVDDEEVIHREDFSMSFEEHEVCNSDDDDDDDDVMERWKMELRSVRTGGLATILEESETPLEEPKPLKVDAKLELKDRIAEIQQVYKSYTAKMRKLDVLDSQTMHSINLIKLKDCTKPSGYSQDSDPSVRAAKSPLRQNLWPFKTQQLRHDPVERLVRDVGRDFETVYVGHLCVSWEILRWQYVKVLEFCRDDPKGSAGHYNVVAGELQLFRVLLQRFMESEPFQSCSRIQNYLKNRRCFHSFLQVPLVRDDRSSKASKCANQGASAVTIEMLREIIQESMHVFWEFVCAERRELGSISKVSRHAQVSPQDPLDLELLTDIRTNLRKKERRVKQILRSETCMVKKTTAMKKKRAPLKEELVIAQVELKLVSRVTSMSKLRTGQLVWCQEKLNNINFTGPVIHMEPSSFSWFPC